MIKLRAFIFGSVVDLYWGYTHRRNYETVDNILKIINCLRFLHFTFSPCTVCFEKHITMNCWLIWQSCQGIYAIISCPSWVSIFVIHYLIVLFCDIVCRQSSLATGLITDIHAHKPLVYAH